jgi:O-antigen/teichoic acid export membrane protein
MGLRSVLLKGASVLTAGQMTAQLLMFVRNIILARMLTPEDMGIAATFAITISLLEMTSNLAVEMLLVQAPDGDDPRFQATAHVFQVIRGLLIGILILASAPIIARMFDTPQALWAFQYVAIVPVLRGFMHLDWKRVQRNMTFTPSVIVEIAPQAIITLAAWPMVVWLRDYSAVLWLVIIQAAIALLASQLVAERNYQLNWSRVHASRLLSFGWPLLINGLLMFGVFQGDRLIVGTAYSMAELGVYSVAFALVMMIAMTVSKLASALLLPLFSRVQEDQATLRRYFLLSVQVLALLGAVIALPLVIIGGDIIVLIYGEQYTSATEFIAWMGVLIAVRIFRLGPTIAALAKGDSKNSMIANMFRTIGVLGAVVVAWLGLPLSSIIICGIVGEILALMAAVWRLWHLYGIQIFDSITAPFIVSTILLIAGIVNVLGWTEAGVAVRIAVSATLILALVVMAVLILPDLRRIAVPLNSGRFNKGQ